MSHNFGTDGGEINMDQAFNAPIMAIRFGLATGAAGQRCSRSGAHPEDVVDRFTDRPVWIRGVGLGLDSSCTSTSTI